MKKWFWMVCSVVLLVSCAGSGSKHVDETLPIERVLFAPEDYGKRYGYLYLTHDKVWGNPTLSHLVMDNCRYAGTFHSETFILVKLLPGRHVIRVVRPPEALHREDITGNKARLVLDIVGGEVLVYDNHIGWKKGMVLEEKDRDHLKGLDISADCVDCTTEPDPVKSFDNSCFE